MTLRERICTRNLELLSASLRPFYLPQEFPHLFITVVYIYPKACASSACKTIFDVVQKLQSISPDAPNFVLGDFKYVSPSFTQYVTCHTRWEKTLDVCYGSVKEAYKSPALPPLGNGDHNCVHLLPTYKIVLKKERVKKKNIWTSGWRNLCSACRSVLISLTGTCL